MPQKENREQWQFLIDPANASWTWERRRPDGNVDHAERFFGSLHECAAEASHHGFAKWKDDERRRVATLSDPLLDVA